MQLFNLNLAQPGQVEWLTIEPLYLMVRRKKLLGEEYHVIGTWYATPELD